jgi:hypothetical protein
VFACAVETGDWEPQLLSIHVMNFIVGDICQNLSYMFEFFISKLILLQFVKFLGLETRHNCFMTSLPFQLLQAG